MAGYYVPSRFCMRTDGVVAAVEAAAAAASMEATDGAHEAAEGSDSGAFVMLGGVRYFRTGDIGELVKGAMSESPSALCCRIRADGAWLGLAWLGFAWLGSRSAPSLRTALRRYCAFL